MIRTVIIDDEKPSRERVSYFLEEYNEIIIIGEAENGGEGRNLINSEKPQLVFLDIQMPIADGFHVLEGCTYHPAVIFISAYDEYAIRAFEVNAVDYLLKPFSRQRFDSSMKRVLATLEDKDYWEDKLSGILESYHSGKNYLSRITVKQNYVYRVMETSDIDFFRVEEGLVFLYSSGERINIDTPLAQLEKRLSPSLYLRVHRNSIVNLKKIKNAIPWGTGKWVLDYGKSGRVQVSRNKVKILKEKIGLKI